MEDGERRYFMILQYGEDTFEEAVKNMDRQGIPPAERDNLGLTYQHIFWALKEPQEILGVKPDLRGRKIMAINSEGGGIIKPELRLDREGQPYVGILPYGFANILVKDSETGLPQLLVAPLDKDDLFIVSNCEKIDLSKF